MKEKFLNLLKSTNRENIDELIDFINKTDFFDAIFNAKAFAIAVFPTPGSPIRQGLFLERLFKIWITL